MKATEITMQIVKSIGLYETCRLEATFTLDEKDDLTQSFVTARKQLEKAFETAYGIKTEKTENKEKRAIDVNSQEFERICKALYLGSTDLKELEKYYTFDSHAMFYLKEKKLI